MSARTAAASAFHRTDRTAEVLHLHGDCADYCTAPARMQREACLDAALARDAYRGGFYADALTSQLRAAQSYKRAREWVAT